jgi:hypothetical protein
MNRTKTSDLKGGRKTPVDDKKPAPAKGKKGAVDEAAIAAA